LALRLTRAVPSLRSFLSLRNQRIGFLCASLSPGRVARRGHFFVHASSLFKGEQSPMTSPTTPVTTTAKKQHDHEKN
jgi:hypothetical protein